MKPLLLSEFAETVKGVQVGMSPAAKFSGFALDNRECKPGDIFIAIKGERVDGHDYASDAFKAGCVAALVERSVDGPHILVPNVIAALAAFASKVREGFQGPVVAVTGSAGKTTTKEFVAAALSPLGPCLKTEGNRNSEFSSPLLWADLEEDTKSVVVEMGMRGFGQVAHLASFTKPTIGIITNIGVSHIELVGSRDGVARAKGELLDSLPKDGAAVLWAEDPYFDKLAARSKGPVKSFGFSKNADCCITRYAPIDWKSCAIEGAVGTGRFKAILPSVGRHMALNAAAAAVLAASLTGVEPTEAAQALSKAELPPMRMEIIRHNGVTIVLDAYNASPSSVIAALETLAELPADGQRIAVLGDMRELGSQSEQGHREVGAALARFCIDRTLLYGEQARWIGSAAQATGMPSGSIRYAETMGEISNFVKSLSPGDVVLIKGSRALEMERSLEFLKEPAK